MTTLLLQSNLLDISNSFIKVPTTRLNKHFKTIYSDTTKTADAIGTLNTLAYSMMKRAGICNTLAHMNCADAAATSIIQAYPVSFEPLSNTIVTL